MAEIKGPNGQVALVDDTGRLLTFTVSEPEDKEINKNGGAHSAYITVTTVGTDDYFLYLKNNGISDIFLTDFRASSLAPTTVYYESVSGIPAYVSASEVPTLNRNLGSPKSLTVDINSDSDITGLTSLGVLFFEKLPVANSRENLKTTSTIIIPQGKAVAFRSSVAATLEIVVSIIDGGA